MAQNTNTTNGRGHAFDRVEERLTEAGFTAETRAKFFKVADLLARASKIESEALQLLTLPAQVGQAWSDKSNGNTVVAIVRNGRLATVMLRRETQPFTAEALNVKKVTKVN